MTFRGIWVIDVEHRVVLFSRRFPNVERSYLSHMSPPSAPATQQQHNANEASAAAGGGLRSPSNRNDTVDGMAAASQAGGVAPQQRTAHTSAGGGGDALTSILGVSDTMLMDSLLSYIEGSNLVGGDATTQHADAANHKSDGSRATLLSTVASASHSSPGLARMKHGPFIPPLPIAVEADGGGGGRSVVGPWVVCQSERGAVTIVSPPSAAPDNSGKGVKKLSGGKATTSTSSLPPLNLQAQQLVVLEHPDDVPLAESHPRYAPKQNILIVALPLCRSAHSSSGASSSGGSGDAAYLSDPTILSAWEVVQASLRPFVDHCLLVAPQLPPRSKASAGPPVVLQPHGMIVAPSSSNEGSGSFQPTQDAPATWLDPKVGARLLHVVGGWSTRTTQRRVIAVFHWVQALHTLVATAMPFGLPTMWLPQHSVKALGVGTAFQVRAEQRVDASLKNIMNPSMEPEALFQSVESGDRKLRGSEMLFVDTLSHHSGGGGVTPPSSSSDPHYGSSRSDDFSSPGGAASHNKRRSVPSRAMKLIKDYDSRAAKLAQQQQGVGISTGADKKNARVKKLWDPMLPSAACVGLHLVFEVSTQMFGHASGLGGGGGGSAAAATQISSSNAATSSASPAAQAAAAVAAASVDAYHACYRIQLLPPQSPNMHWLQRVEELAEAVEEGIAAVLLEDTIPLALVVPASWRGAHGTGGGARVAVDESLVSAVDWHADQQLHAVQLKGSSSSSSTAGSGSALSAAAKKGSKGSALVPAVVQALADDPVGVVNASLDVQAKQRSGKGSQCCDVITMVANGAHLWAYQRTCGLARPEEALHAPIDLAVLSPPAFLPQQHVVTGLYSLTPVATPAFLHTALSKYFGYDEAGMTSDLEVLTSADRADAQRSAKPNPTDDDLEHRAWLEGLLETPGHVMYHMDLELTVPTSLPAAESSHLSAAEVLTFASVIRFLDDVSIVSLHLLQSTAHDEHNVLLYSNSNTANAGGVDGGSSSRDAQQQAAKNSSSGGQAGTPLHQIASDAVVWQSPAPSGAILRCGSKLRLKAFLVLDLRSRSGAHELQSTLLTTHAHMNAAEWRQLTTVISSAQLDFMLRTVDPMISGGVQLLDCGIAGAAFPALSKSLELRASVLQSDLGSLHDSTHIGGPDDAVSLLRESHASVAAASQPTLQPPPVMSSTIVCSGRAETGGGYVLWNFSPAQDGSTTGIS